MKNGKLFGRATWFALVCALVLASNGVAAAQSQRGGGQGSGGAPPPPRGSRTSTLRVEIPPPVAEAPVPFEGGRGGSFQPLSFVSPELNFERNVVKGAPFAAESVTEHVQTLADGNRLVRKSSARIFRDGAGRTRREHAEGRGARAPGGGEPSLIVINDPVAQVNYIIETRTGLARKMILPPGLAEARQRALGGGETSFGVLVPGSVARRRMAEGDAAGEPPRPKKERLETQLIEGVLAEGTRTTLTIPAGEFDNEQPLEITHEQWYSPELKMVVLMRNKDPRFGETVYRLTNIVRAEPAPSLFEVPDGYKVVDGADPRAVPMRGRPMNER